MIDYKRSIKRDEPERRPFRLTIGMQQTKTAILISTLFTYIVPDFSIRRLGLVTQGRRKSDAAIRDDVFFVLMAGWN